MAQSTFNQVSCETFTHTDFIYRTRNQAQGAIFPSTKNIKA